MWSDQRFAAASSMSAPLTGAGNFKNSKMSGWLGALKANGVHEHAHSPEPVKEQFCKSDSDYKSIWSPDIAAAMGYGKRWVKHPWNCTYDMQVAQTNTDYDIPSLKRVLLHAHVAPPKKPAQAVCHVASVQ